MSSGGAQLNQINENLYLIRHVPPTAQSFLARVPPPSIYIQIEGAESYTVRRVLFLLGAKLFASRETVAKTCARGRLSRSQCSLFVFSLSWHATARCPDVRASPALKRRPLGFYFRIIIITRASFKRPLRVQVHSSPECGGERFEVELCGRQQFMGARFSLKHALNHSYRWRDSRWLAKYDFGFTIYPKSSLLHVLKSFLFFFLFLR